MSELTTELLRAATEASEVFSRFEEALAAARVSPTCVACGGAKPGGSVLNHVLCDPCRKRLPEEIARGLEHPVLRRYPAALADAIEWIRKHPKSGRTARRKAS